MNNCSGSNQCRDSRGACAPPFKWAPRSKTSGPTEVIGLQKAEVLKAHGPSRLGMTRNCIFPQTVKPGAYKKRWRARDGRSEQRPYEKRRAEKGAPIKNIGSDTGHRTPKGGGAENARPFEAQAKQAAPLRETEGAAKAGPYMERWRARDGRPDKKNRGAKNAQAAPLQRTRPDLRHRREETVQE